MTEMERKEDIYYSRIMTIADSKPEIGMFLVYNDIESI